MANQMIFGLIQKAMGMIGAIGKDSVNEQQKFRYRGIDAVYNALNPIMSELGLFICPEILDHKREERRKVKEYGGKPQESVLLYSILTIKYTMYAPDGSNISCVVIGEGMDSGDKASNKAMSVALKYAMFQLFMIPTEEMVDPDAEVHENVLPKQEQKAFTPPQATQAEVTKAATVPEIPKPEKPKKPEPTPVQVFLLKAMKELRAERGISVKENNTLFTAQFNALKEKGIVPDKPLDAYTLDEAEALIDAMYKKFSPTGTEIKQ